MKQLSALILLLFLACSLKEKSVDISFHKVIKGSGMLILDGDTLNVFPDTLASFALNPFEFSKDSVEISYLDSLDSKILMGKLRNRQSTDADWHYFIEDRRAPTNKRWWINMPSKKSGTLLECQLQWWYIPSTKDSLICIEYQLFKHDDSPYFYEDWTQSGLQIWDLKRQKALAQFFPLNTSIEKGDIIKGDYDEEVQGTPTIGTIVYNNVCTYSTDFTPQGIKFTLYDHYFTYDSSDLEADYVDSFEIEYRKDLIQADTISRIEYVLKRN